MFRFIPWNVRGINDWDKRALLKNFLMDWNVISFVSKRQNLRKLSLLIFVAFGETKLLILRFSRL